MKRSLSTETGSPTKRPRTCDAEETIFDDAKQERMAMDIFKNGTDDTGYLSGRIFMIWPVMGNKLKAIFEARPGGQAGPHKFDVEFTGACAGHFDDLCFKAHDEVLLALKGARVERSGSKISTLKMKLHYTEGTLVKLVKRRGDLHSINKIVNTWKQKHSPPSDSLYVPEPEDWFSTPHRREPTLPDPSIAPAKASTPVVTAAPAANLIVDHPPLLAACVNTKGQQQCLPSVSTDDHDPFTDQKKSPRSHTPHPNVAQLALQTDRPAPTLTKKQQKQQRKLAQKQRKLDESKALTSVEPSTDRATISKIPEPLYVQGTPKKDVTPPVPPPSTESKLLAGKITNPPTPLHTKEPKIKPPEILPLKAGFVTSRGDKYSAIDTLKLNGLVHMIGVVISVTERSTTSKGDLSCSLKIVDPSIITAEYFSTSEGFKINCFARKYMQWLPYPALGDIIILRNIKIGEWNGLNGVGYPDRLQWAVYSTKNGKVTHGDLQNVPWVEGLAGGTFGQPYSPFFKPTEEEIRYCLKLFDWWQDVDKYRQGLSGDVHQVQVLSRAQRKHRLISEVDPSIPPQGYFNCTVEVWYVHMNDNGVYSLYVTDYTANSSIIPCSQQWCPPKLSDFILKVEVWDSAVEFVKTMVKGEFYLIKNLRAVTSTGGYLEGKLVEHKMERLEEAAASHNGPLGALLERKRAWEEGNPPVINTFEFSLIEDVSVNQHFTCAVEVVHVVPGTGYIYVTDYTSRAELSSLVLNEPWAAGLHGSIVKILLQEGQVEMSNIVAKGEYYLINNLRLKPSTVASQFLGYLGGYDNLIKKINVTKDNDNLDALLTRKAQWLEKMKTNGSKPNATVPTALTHPTVNPGYTTINEIVTDEKCPNKFRVEARIVDFYPPDPYDWVVTHCIQCQEDLPKNRIACTNCNDSEYEFRRYFYQLFFLLEDEHGKKLEVSVNDDCSLFKGLERVDLRTNRKGYEALCARLELVFGSVEKVLEERANNMPTLSATPAVSLIINSWEVEGEQKRAYCVASVKGKENS